MSEILTLACAASSWAFICASVARSLAASSGKSTAGATLKAEGVGVVEFARALLSHSTRPKE